MPSNPLSRADILCAIDKERQRQDSLFNTDAAPTDFIWPSICAEQLGKALSVLQYLHRTEDPTNERLVNAYETELIKTAASAVQAIERIQPLKHRLHDHAHSE